VPQDSSALERSSEELTRACLDAIEHGNEALNAFAALTLATFASALRFAAPEVRPK